MRSGMVTFIENIFLNLNISELDKVKVKEANFYIDFLLEIEKNQSKRECFNQIKNQILDRMEELGQSELFGTQKANLKKARATILVPSEESTAIV